MNAIQILEEWKDKSAEKKASKAAIIDKFIQSNPFSMVHIMPFVRQAGFEFREVLPLKMMLESFHKDIPILITDDLVRAFGYKGELKTQRVSLMKIIKKYDISIVQMVNDEYNKFLRSLQAPQNEEKKDNISSSIDLYPEPDLSNGKGKSLHTFIMPRYFKELLLVVNTENGHLFRKYVLDIEEAMQLYALYQKEFERSVRLRVELQNNELNKNMKVLLKDMDSMKMKNREQTNMLTEMKEEQEAQTEMIEEMFDRLDYATDERAPKTESEGKQGKFILVKLNRPGYTWHIHAIRSQTVNVKKAYDKVRREFPNCKKVLSIDYQPNAVNLFNLIKEKLRNEQHNIEVAGNKIKLRAGYSHEQFLADVREIDANKKEV